MNEREQTAVVRTVLYALTEPAEHGTFEQARATMAAELEGWTVSASWGSVVAFDRPLDAVRLALALQRLARSNDVVLRTVVHLNEILLDEAGCGRLGSVPDRLLSRLATVVRHGQIVLTRGAYDLAQRAAVGETALPTGLKWLSHGMYEVVDMDETHELFEVGERDLAPLLPPAGNEQVRRWVGGDTSWEPESGAAVPRRPNWCLQRRIWHNDGVETWVAEHTKTGDQELFSLCSDIDRLVQVQRIVTVFRLLKESFGERRDLCRILDWSFDDAPFFIEWEWSDGGTLSDYAANRGGLDQLPMANRLRVVAALADTIAAIHSVGVVHSAISADSVLIAHDRDGTPYPVVANFAAGQITDVEQLADHKITMLGVLPEPKPETESDREDDGDVATVDADIAALGQLLAQLVEGDLGLRLGNGAEYAGLIDSDPEVRALVTAAVARPPKIDATALAGRLRDLVASIDGEALTERPAPPSSETIEPTVSWLGRRSWWLVGAATLILAILLVLAL